MSRVRYMRAVVASSALLAICALAVVLGPATATAAAGIVSRGAASVATYPSESTTTLTLTAPSGAQSGDVLIASLGFGRSGASSQPLLTAPSGWTLVSRTNQGADGSLAVYSHVFAAGESSYTWNTNVAVGGTAFLAAYGGVDTANPIDVSKGQTVKKSQTIPAPSVTTTMAGETLVAGYFANRGGATSTTWTAPSGMTEIGDASNGSRSGALDYASQASAGKSGTKTATASARQDFGIGVLTALRPADSSSPPPPPPSGPVPVTLDTDIFSNTDDVGALAIAFALQLKNEARVIAMAVNTRTSRPSVATNSWQCAAAISQFYNSGSVPIGSDMPDNGTETNSPDFIGPCSELASSSTPSPDTAVNIYRRALVGQADGSVVMIGFGYFENLSALLNSPADSISPLTGRELIAQKVNRLVVMGGGYPSRSGENNLIGNIAAAQNVANNWPTKLVWSGYEVGDAVHTGQTISGMHPASSPVRVSYEAFVGPNNWTYSYDPTAVYHAIRPSDSLLSEVGPGTNVVNNQGGNTFTTGSGNQYYLRLSDATALDSAIENLLDTLPSAAPGDTTAPSITGVGAGSISSSGATIAWGTDEPADSQVEYGTTSSYGSATPLNTTLTLSHSQTISGLAAGTLYHYRVKSRDPAGNLAVSPDFTFTTADTATPASGPNDDFSSASLDPAKWIVTTDDSTVSSANGQLQITHPAGGWTKGAVDSAAPYDQSGESLQLQLIRAANGGGGGSTFGETTVRMGLDSSHYADFFVAGGSLSAWVNRGAGETNLTPSWPAYDPTRMQWLRFRESAGTLYWEYASGATSPGPWTVLASTPDPFPMSGVRLRIVAGSNVNATDTAQFDNVSTY
jgi:Inosine-uridine preferring nucleoside hydrolase/Purple acid Phosphatase, N-terminal domain